MNEKRQPVSIRKLLIGTLLGILGAGVLIMSVAMLDSFVQVVLFVPDLLGLVKHVTPENTYEYSEPGTYIINNLAKGDYLVYVNQFSTLPHVTLTSLTTGQTIVAQEFLVEGKRLKHHYSQPYHLVREFTVSASGNYEITVANFSDSLRITPDISKNMAIVFVLGLISQSWLIYYFYRTIYRWLNREKIAAAQKFRDTRGEKFDEWFTHAKEKKNS